MRNAPASAGSLRMQRDLDRARALDQLVAGVLERTGAVDYYVFQARKGEKFTLQIAARPLHSELDSVLRILDAKGETLAENDDFAPDNLNSRLVFTLAQDDTYRLVATSYKQQGTGTYSLTVRLFIQNAK